MNKFSAFFFKQTLVGLFLFAFCVPLNAKKIEVESATSVAQFVAEMRFDAALRGAETELVLAYTAYSQKIPGTPVYYVFNVGREGFIIVSADDLARPVLGYSSEGNYNHENLPPNFKGWMDEIGDYIAFAIEKEISADADIQEEWSACLSRNIDYFPPPTRAVNPLFTTTWAQGDPYNQDCPSCGSTKTITGCVATAMAQIMKYHGYPTTGTGSSTAYTIPCGTTVPAVNFNTTYNYNDMGGNTPSTASQKANVAKLMYHSGVSVKMQYGTSSSGAYDYDFGLALINHFKYDKELEYVRKTVTVGGNTYSYYNDAHVVAFLKGELEASRPVYWGGSGPQGGHAFVCNGFNNSDQFHINWGWGGSYNGYFTVNALNPGSYSFPSNHTFFRNIKPDPSGTSVLTHRMFLIENTSITTSLPSGFNTPVHRLETFTFDTYGYRNHGYTTFPGGYYGVGLYKTYVEELVAVVTNPPDYISLPIPAGAGFFDNITFACAVPVTVPPGDYILRPIVSLTQSPYNWKIAWGDLNKIDNKTINVLSPQIVINPVSLDFGTVIPGTPSTKTIQISILGGNSGNQNITVTKSGAFASQYDVTPTTLPPTGGTVTVTFTPASSGNKDITLIFQCTGFSNKTINVTGTGATQNIVVNPASLNFGNVATGTTSPGQNITVTGTNLAQNITWTKSGTDAAAFNVTPSSLAPTGGTLVVTFSPTTTGAHSATLTITSADPSSPNRPVTLSGTGFTPTITVNPTSLSFGNVNTGTTSTAQTITVTGVSLTGNITVTKSGTGAAAFNVTPSSLPAAGGTVSVTFSPTAAQAYNATLTFSSAGAADKTVTLSGTGVTPTITVSPTSLNFGDVITGTTSPGQTVTVTGAYLGGNITVTKSGTGAAAFNVTPTSLPAAGGTLTVTFAPTTAGAHSATITLSCPGAADKTVTLSGTGIVPSITVNPTSLNFGSVVTGNTSPPQTITITGVGLNGNITYTKTGTGAAAFNVSPPSPLPSGGGTVTVTFSPTAAQVYNATLTFSNPGVSDKTVTLSGTGAAIAITTDPSSLNFGNVITGTTSAAQTIAVSGTNLTGSITVTKSGTGAAAFTVTPASLPSTGGTINVTFSPTAAQSYSATITLSSPGAADKTVTLSGTGITPTITVNPTSLNFGNVITGTTSAEQTVTITGVSLSGSITVTKSGAGAAAFTVTPASLPSTGGAINVTFSPTAAQSYSATITLSSPGATDKTVTLNGTGITPTITVNPTSLNFGNVVVGATSAGQMVTVTGVNLSGNISITKTGAGAGAFNISQTSLPATGGSVSVTFEPTTAQTYNATLTFSSANAVDKTVTLSGTGVVPTITVNPLSLDFGEVTIGLTSAAQTLAVTGANITGNITVTKTGNDATAFNVSPTSLPAAGGTLNVTFTPSAAQAHSATLTLSNPGVADQTVTLNGTGLTPTYTITATAGANGTIEPSESITVIQGENQTFTFTPDNCYEIDKVLIDGINDANAVAAGEYTFINVAANHTISVSFKLKTYTITATAGANGSITPGTTTVNCGDNQTYHFNPELGYEIDKVTVDGVTLDEPENFYLFVNIKENHTIHVSFKITTVQQYTITATAGANGAINPNADIIVNSASNQTFLFIPDDNYIVEQVLVDEKPVSIFNNYYTFTNITNNHTIYVTFAPINDIPTVTDKRTIVIYPNPTTGLLTITNYDLQITNVEIFDIYGRKQKAESRKQNTEWLMDLSNLPRGIYFARIITETGMITKKVLKH